METLFFIILILIAACAAGIVTLVLYTATNQDRRDLNTMKSFQRRKGR